MQKKLHKEKKELYHYVDGQKVFGENSKMSGDCSYLSGNCSRLSGDLDDCEITKEERKKGVNIKNLVK